MGKPVWRMFTCALSYLILLSFNQCVVSTSPSVHKDHTQLYEGSSCQLENGQGLGVCTKASDCPKRLQQIREGQYDGVGRCGFWKFDEIVCCSTGVSPGDTKNSVRPAEVACKKYKEEVKAIVDDQDQVYIVVFNGVSADPGEFPHMAALGYPASKDEAPGGIKYICGGTLISRKHVLTAAHCVSNIQGLMPVEVLLGTIDLDETTSQYYRQRVPISRIIKHPQYRRTRNYHDVAILELKSPVNLTSDVHPTCLLTNPLTSENATNLVVLGWGAIDLDGTTSTKLLKAEFLNFVNKTKCSDSYKSTLAQIPNGLDDGMICVSDPDKNRKADTCWGDSGGPLLISAKRFPLLAGVTSFGQACGGNTPGVYASVYQYLDWIESVVWPN